MSVSFGTAELMSVAATLGWASGLRLYAVLFLTGLAGRYAGIGLPEGLHWLMHPLVLGASGLMLLVEFLADKYGVQLRYTEGDGPRTEPGLRMRVLEANQIAALPSGSARPDQMTMAAS